MAWTMHELFEKPKKGVPNFGGRVTHIDSELPPIRAYFHNYGFVESYGNFDSGIAFNCADSLVETLHNHVELTEDVDYFIAALWGLDGMKMIDLIAFSDINPNDWQGSNPDVDSYFFQNRIYRPEKTQIGCEDLTIILGDEARHRRTMYDLDEFMKKPPVIKGLIPRRR